MTGTDRFGGALPRYVAVLVAAVLGLSLFPAAASAQTTADDPCEGAPVANEYVDRDDARDVHETNIDCVLFRNIAVGSTNAQGQQIYQPLNPVTRGQMASFVANALVAGGYDDELPAGDEPDEFDDIGPNVHKTNINRLARAGIVNGTDENSYSPNGLITRQQMASFMVQAAEFALGRELVADADFPFTDVSASNVHRSNINKGEDNALFRGVTATTFRPGLNVLRDQMATFLVNLLRLIFNAEQAPPVVVVSDADIAPGQPVTGEITGDAASAVVSGCGLNNQTVNDSNSTEAGIQFSIPIPSTQTSNCTLTFTITGANGDTFTRTVNVRITTPGGGATATTRPELLAATVGTPFSNPNTSTACNGGGLANGAAFNQVQVRFDFDENLTGAAFTNTLAARFQLVSNDPNSPAPYNGVCADRDPNDASIVIVTFGTPGTPVGASQLTSVTVATVMSATVTDNQNQTNPNGDATVGQASTQTGQAGITSAPDLLRVENFRRVTVALGDDRTQVDFFFDETAYNVDSNGYHLVLVNGTQVNCVAVAGPTGGAPGAGENADDSITVNCGNANDAEILAASVARGFVDPATVSDSRTDIAVNCAPGACAGNTNVLQATTTPDAASAHPDIDTIVLRPGSTSSAVDEVLFRFDEAVVVPGGAPGIRTANTNFFAYTGGGATVQSTFATRSTVNPNEVLVEFPAGTIIENAIGGYVLDGAVLAQDNATANQEDEVGVTNNTATTITPGRTQGPDLTAIRIEVSGRDPFTNDPNDYTAIFVFDEDLDTTVALTPGEFILLQADGTILTCTDAVYGTSANSGISTVRCRVITGQSGNAETALGSAVAGTVEYDSVRDSDANPNPIGYEVTSGGTGTPRS